MAPASGTVADLVVARLAAAGVGALFGVPGGGGNLDLIDAASRAGLPFVLTSSETAAVIAAIGYAEATGACGACLTTLGPGVSSATNGVACACLERAPLLVFTDRYGDASPGEHQRLDHHALMSPVTKGSLTLSAATAATVIGEAVALATSGRPGPVHIDCPGDVMRMPAQAPLPAASHASRDPAASASEDDALARLIASARRPLLIAGLGARAEADALAIRRLCERTTLPAMVTYKGKGIVADDDPLFAGVFTNAQLEYAVIADSDLLIGVGLDPVELLPRRWPWRQPIVSLARWRVDNGHVPFAAQRVGDIVSAIDRVGATIRSTWTRAEVRRHADAQRQAVRLPAATMTAQEVVEIAADRLAPIGHVAVDAGAHMFAATMLWPARHAGELLISNGLSTMGFALPAAIGAAVADQNRPVVALTGDGGLLMCAGELLTVARERLPVITVVFSDRSLSLIEIKQRAKRLAPNGVALAPVDWPELARSFGIPAAFAAATGPELTDALDRAVAARGPALVEARIDRSNYPATFTAVRG